MPGTKVSPLRTGVKWQESLENCINEETQMTAITSTDASSAMPKDIWSDLNWPALEGIVLRLQMRIAKAEREGKRGKVRALQRLLTTSLLPNVRQSNGLQVARGKTLLALMETYGEQINRKHEGSLASIGVVTSHNL